MDRSSPRGGNRWRGNVATDRVSARRGVSVRRLWPLSLVLLAAGIALIVGGSVLSLGPTWVLAGLLLFWAGVVKVVVVHLWRGVANPEHVGRQPVDEI